MMELHDAMLRALLVAVATRENGHTLRAYYRARKRSKTIPLTRRRAIGYLSAVLFVAGAILVALGILAPSIEPVGWAVCGISFFIATATPCSYAWVNAHGTVFVIRNILFALQGAVCLWFAFVG